MFYSDHMANGMMLGMGFFALLGVIVLLLAIAALTKYVFSGKAG